VVLLHLYIITRSISDEAIPVFEVDYEMIGKEEVKILLGQRGSASFKPQR